MRALIATALLATAVTAAPSRYQGTKHHQDYYAPCKYEHKQTWWDKNGVEYGWEDNKACIVKKHDGYKHDNYGHDNYKDNYGHDNYKDNYGHDNYKDNYGHDNYKDNYGHDNYKDNYGHDNYKDNYGHDNYKQDKPKHNKPYYGSISYAGTSYGYDDAKCDYKYLDKTYQECNESFGYAKEKYCSRYSHHGTKHGDCITEVSHSFDKCIRAMDNHKPYCWDPKYLPEDGYYEKPKDTYYEEPKDNYYEKPKDTYYEEPKDNYYEKPKDNYYEEPKDTYYEEPKKSYLQHAGTTYEEPKDKYYEEPKDKYYEEPKDKYYEEPKDKYYEEPKDKYYEEPKDKYYEEPKDNYYEKPKDHYGKSYDCKSATHYFKSTGSPTLKQCVAIACAPGQTHAYIERALYQCYALEKDAKRNNHGKLPHGW